MICMLIAAVMAGLGLRKSCKCIDCSIYRLGVLEDK